MADSDMDHRQASSVADVFEGLSIDELADELSGRIPESDLEVLKAQNIDGGVFLELLTEPELRDTYNKLSGGGRVKIKRVLKEIEEGRFKFRVLKPVEPDMPWCSTQSPVDMPNGSGKGAAASGGGMHKAILPSDAVWPWEDCKKLYVEFRDVYLLAKWTIGDGQPMNTDTILRHANIWNDMGGGRIPRFVEAKNGQTAQIRVSFNNDRICESQLGRRAQTVKQENATMYLDLDTGCPDDEYKKHVIMHEFGHALGLGHEHQRSDFWKCVEPHTDTEKMKKDLKVTEEQFAAQWKETDFSSSTKVAPHATDYDPDSIMHYWFKVEWLINGYSDKKAVEKDRKKLGDKVTDALLGIHRRHNVLAPKPSTKDIELLQEVYGGREATGGVIEQPKTDEGDAKPKSGPPGLRTDIDTGDIIDMTTGTDAESTSDSVGAPKQKKAKEQKEIVFKQEYDVEMTNAYLGRMELSEDGKTEVIRIYDKSMNKWRVIGDSLGIDECFLDSIEGLPPDSRIRKVLGKWQENACQLSHPDRYPKSWGGLLNLLKDSDLPELAKNVHKALLQLEQKSPSKTNQMAGGPPAPANGQNGRQARRVMAGGPPAPANGQNGGQDDRVMAGGPPAPAYGGQGSELTKDDLEKVNNAVRGARSQWYHIGLALGLKADDLDPIKDDNQGNTAKCLTDVLKAFLRQVDPKPSWKRLADAMASPAVSRGDIAAELRKQYNC